MMKIKIRFILNFKFYKNVFIVIMIFDYNVNKSYDFINDFSFEKS